MGGRQGLYEDMGLPGIPVKRAVKRPEGRAPAKGDSCVLLRTEANRIGVEGRHGVRAARTTGELFLDRINGIIRIAEVRAGWGSDRR